MSAKPEQGLGARQSDQDWQSHVAAAWQIDPQLALALADRFPAASHVQTVLGSLVTSGANSIETQVSLLKMVTARCCGHRFAGRLGVSKVQIQSSASDLQNSLDSTLQMTSQKLETVKPGQSEAFLCAWLSLKTGSLAQPTTQLLLCNGCSAETPSPGNFSRHGQCCCCGNSA